MEGIPSCIGNLTNLTFLHLEYNQLSGEIPSEIGDLTNLVWLNFIHNQLSGQIPSSICNLDMSWSNPDNFNIYENQLCPPYPECVEDYIGEQDTSECGEPDPQIGDECVTQDGWIGFYDCELCCWEEWIIENWLGDGWCDYLGGCGFEGPLFNCPELGYDCGDCNEDWDGTDQSGLCSDDCLFPGDVNNDSILNILDIVLMITLILDGEYDECGDINSDGDMNILDIVTLVNIILYDSCNDGEIELWGECYSIENTTEILLPSSELTGEIPESIGDLINLNSLVLYNNQLSGKIPESIENLTNLMWLNLYNNQLTGEIPESIGNLTNLTSLDLGFNQFSGEIPVSLGNLTNLNSLWLYHNQLNGEIPITICNINQNLEHFYIYDNQLCPPYPECLTEEEIGEQDTSNCP